MNWLHFTCWVVGCYVIYYLALILLDFARHKRPLTTSSGELTFSEDIQPKKIDLIPENSEVLPKAAPKLEPAIIASGGVSLKNLFGLCRDEAVLYTKAVAF